MSDDGPSHIGSTSETSEIVFPSYIDSFREYMRLLGKEIPISYIMGISGEAFKLFYDRSQPSRGLKVFLQNPFRTASNALGYSYEIRYDEKLQAAFSKLQENLAFGKPVIVHIKDQWLLILANATDGFIAFMPDSDPPKNFISFQDISKSWEAEEGFLELGLYGYYQFTLDKVEREPKERDVALGAFRRAVKIAKAYRKIRGCTVGLEVYDDAIANLRYKRDYSKIAESELNRLLEWNAEPLFYYHNARKSVVEYLNLIKPHFEAEEELEHIEKAIQHYSEVVEVFDKLRRTYPSASPLSGREDRLDSEDEKMRKKAFTKLKSDFKKSVSILEKLRKVEEDGINELEKVVMVSEKSRM